MAQRVFVFGGGDGERVVRVFTQFVACNHHRGDGRGVVQQRDETGRFGVRRRQRFDFGERGRFFRRGCGGLCGLQGVIAQFFDEAGRVHVVFVQGFWAFLRDVVRLTLAAHGVDVARAAFAHGAAVDFFRRVEQRFEGGVDVVFGQGTTVRLVFAARRGSGRFFARGFLL